MIESLDEFYSASLGEEISRGLRESASRGFYVSGHVPYGCQRVKVRDGKKERTKLEPDPIDSAMVACLFADVAAGKGLKEVAKELRAEGIPSPVGRGWSKTTVDHILRNEAYMGVLTWGRNSRHSRAVEAVRVENAWPASVSRQIFDRVQQMLSERKPALT
jgi:site-specific DNA recombinase